MKFKYMSVLMLLFLVFVSISSISAIDIDSLNSTSDTVSIQSSIDEIEEVSIEDNQSTLYQNLNTVEVADVNSYEIYVGKNITDDGGNGSYENPFSTLDLACENVHGEDKVTVNIFDGTYYIGSELKFNTNNLFIKGVNGTVIIKNMYDAKKVKQSLELTSSSANYTISNIIFDASQWSNGFSTRQWFTPFYGNANSGTFNNCTFFGNVFITGSNNYNLKFINCIFTLSTYTKLFYYNLGSKSDLSYCYFENCIFLEPSFESLASIFYLNKNFTLNGIWFGQNTIPDYLKNQDSSTGSASGKIDIPVEKYAIFSVSETYLSDNLYEIIGKLCWNGTNDTVGDSFAPMTVTLTSATGDIQTNATLENGVFRAVYRSNSSDNLVTATLDYQPINLNFTNVEFQVDAPSIFYGQDQNITITSPLASNATVNVTVNNKTYEVKFNDSSVVTFTVPEVLKEGTYPVEVLLNDNENHIFGSNSTELVVSKVSDYAFEVIPSTDVKVGDNVTITITLPDDVNGTVTVKFGNETQTLQANTTMTVTFNNLNATTYPINVTYEGNDKYTSKEAIDSVTVNKADSSLKIENAVFTYGDVIAIPFNMTNANGVTVSVLNKDDDEVATGSGESNVIALDALPAGEYTLYAKTVVDAANYEWVDATINLTINKANSSLEISDKEFTYADEAIINAATENSTGDVIATLIDENNEEIEVTVSKDNITLPLLNVGKYTLTVTTNVTDNYNNVTKSATITITKTIPSMKVIVKPAENITTKDNVTLTINLPSDATGEVVVKINGKKTDTLSANETITIDLNNKVGDYVVDVAYSGDKNYKSDSATEEFTISKAETSITAKQIDFEEGTASKIEVTVPNIESGIVLVDVAGKKFYGDIDSGKSVITLEGVDAGNYTANVKFFGDDKYNQATTTADVKVSEAKIITELKEQLKEAQDNATQLKENLADANGKVENLTVQLNETQANATKLAEDLDVANGKVENLTTELADALNVVKLGSQFNVTEGTTFVTYAVETGAGEKGALYAFVLRDSNGNPIANATVTFAYKTVVFNSTTDENGTLYLGISTYLAQDALCAMSYLGDETHDATFVAFNFKIQKKATALKASAQTYKVKTKKKLLTVTLKTNKGASRDGKVYLKKGKTVTLTVNGVTYTGKTNANGQVTFKITNLNKKGKYKAVIKFAGTDTYQGSKIKVNIKVK